MRQGERLEAHLDRVFHALSNRTRRSLLSMLRAGPARVGELARPHGISVNAVSKHLFVLERAGLITRSTEGHVQSCVLDAGPLSTAEEWLRAYRKFWNRKLDNFVAYIEAKEAKRK
jgi:DNA-binding transcriptional ArsR family regulator